MLSNVLLKTLSEHSTHFGNRFTSAADYVPTILVSYNNTIAKSFQGAL